MLDWLGDTGLKNFRLYTRIYTLTYTGCMCACVCVCVWGAYAVMIENISTSSHNPCCLNNDYDSLSSPLAWKSLAFPDEGHTMLGKI